MRNVCRGMARGARGLTLIELLVALAIVAILAAVVYPNYANYTQRSHRTQAFADLGACALEAERIRSQAYSFAGIRAGTAPVAELCPQFSPRDATGAGDARYQISVPTATQTAYTLRATPLNGQLGNGIVELDANGARRWDRDDDGNLAEASDASWDE